MNFKSLLSSIIGYDSDNETYSKEFERDFIIPGIPPLFIGAIVLWASTAITYTCLETSSADLIKGLLFLATVLSVLLLVIFAITKHHIALIILYMVIGMLLGASTSYVYLNNSSNVPSSGNYEMVLLEDAKTSNRGSYANAKCFLDDNRTIIIKAFFTDNEELLSNAHIKCECDFSKSKEEYSHSNYLSNVCMQSNVKSWEFAEMRFMEKLLYEIRRSSIQALSENSGDEAGILQALLCGYRRTINDEGTYDYYKKCGIAHLVAVSGAHLAIVAMTVGFFLKLLRLPRTIYVLLCIFFIVSYLLFAGIPISAIRASIMCSLAMICGIAKRRNATLNSLGICTIAFMIIDASSCVSLSLFLSAASTFGIVMFARLFSEWAISMPKSINTFFAGPLSMTVSSNILTLPVSSATFKMLPLISPIANILVAPFFTITCVAGLIALIIASIFPVIAGPVIGLLALTARPLNLIAQELSLLPNACINVEPNLFAMISITIVMVVTLIAFKPRINVKHLATMMVVLIAFCFLPGRIPFKSTADRIVMLDVGQGDAFLLESKGSTLLIDTGNNDSKILQSLKVAGIDEIDAVSISHADSDHCDSLDAVNSMSEDAKFICSDNLIECSCSKCKKLIQTAESYFHSNKIVGIDIGDTFRVGRFSIKAIWPTVYMDKGGNSDSLCLYVTLDYDEDGASDYSALFTGDVESNQLESIINKGNVGDIDVLKVGHHGSKLSLNENVLKSLKPEYALISVGKNNSYGHPNSETIDVLNDFNVKILRTDEDGVVELSFSDGRIDVTKQF